MMQAFIKKMETVPRTVLFSLCMFVTALLGLFDYITEDFSLLIFYLVPIAFATWFTGRAAGLLVSSFGAGALFVSNVMLWQKGTPAVSIKTWNVLMEIAFLLVTSHILYLLKNEFDNNKKRAVELEAANLELDAFNYSVTHDLRKPLSVINGFSQLILELYKQELNDNCREYVQEIYQGTLRMDELIDALLNFSRIGRCVLLNQLVDLSLIAREITANLQLAESKRKITVRIADGMTATGTPELLRSVLENLIGNAWKYTGQTENPVIEVGETVVDGKRTFYVRDNGAGFDMSKADKLFVPFQRLHDSTEFKGHGIGLSTVRRIIERHGGEVWAESREKEGTVFYFTLP